MVFFDYQICDRLENLINVVDVEIRIDFNLGYVVDENDYMFNLIVYIC